MSARACSMAEDREWPQAGASKLATLLRARRRKRRPRGLQRIGLRRRWVLEKEPERRARRVFPVGAGLAPQPMARGSVAAKSDLGTPPFLRRRDRGVGRPDALSPPPRESAGRPSRPGLEHPAP